MPELNDDYLRRIAEERALAADPNALYKEQSRRELKAIMSVIKPSPPSPYPGTIEETKVKLAEMKKEHEAARTVHYQKFGNMSLAPGCQLSLQALSRMNGEVTWMERHLRDLENAARQRSGNPPPEAA